MSVRLRNRKFYPFAFAGTIVAAVAVWYYVFGLTHGALLLSVLSAITAFFYFLYKQHLDETQLFKRLFADFNRRYDRLNGRLNKIYDGDDKIALKLEECVLVFDYFNLCAEEHFFHEAGYIDESVWKAWRGGMAFSFNNPRVRELWNRECDSSDQHCSYYGFEPPPYSGRDPKLASK